MLRVRSLQPAVLVVFALRPQVAWGTVEPPQDQTADSDPGVPPKGEADPVEQLEPRGDAEPEGDLDAEPAPASATADGNTVGSTPSPNAEGADVEAARRRDASRRFDAQHVSFDEVQLRHFPSGMVMARWLEPRKGTNGEVLRGAAYYEYVGRSDLAKTYRKRRKVKWALIGTGAVVGVAGIVPGAVLLEKGLDPTFGCDSEYDPDANEVQYDQECVAAHEKMRAPGIGLLVVGGVGTLVAVAGAIIDPNPVKGDEYVRLGHDYNRRLRQRLGLAPLGSAAQSRVALARDVRLNVAAGWAGAAVQVSGRF